MRGDDANHRTGALASERGAKTRSRFSACGFELGAADGYRIGMSLPPLESLPRRLADLVRYWQGLRGDNADMPQWAQFDICDVAKALANIYLIAVEPEPLRFQFRLLGEAVLDAGAPGRRGLYIDELPRTETEASLHDKLAEAVRQRVPNWYRGPPTLKHHKFVNELEGVMLPFAAADGRIERILCMTLYRWQDGHET